MPTFTLNVLIHAPYLNYWFFCNDYMEDSDSRFRYHWQQCKKKYISNIVFGSVLSPFSVLFRFRRVRQSELQTGIIYIVVLMFMTS